MSQCPQCQKPTPSAEMAAYGKCEECYNPAPASNWPYTARATRIVTGDKPPSVSECRGGRRVIRKTFGSD